MNAAAVISTVGIKQPMAGFGTGCVPGAWCGVLLAARDEEQSRQNLHTHF